MTNEERKLYCKTFGERVKSYREALNMSQKELALAVGYVDKTNPSSSISKIERGEMEVTHEGIKYNPCESIKCYNVRIFGVLKFCPLFMRAFCVCVIVCVN